MTDDELLQMLLANLRNAEATFGTGSAPVVSIKNTMLEHLHSMRARGAKTNLTGRNDQDSRYLQELVGAFGKLEIQQAK